MHQLMKTTKQKGKQIKTQKPNKKRQKDYNPDDNFIWIEPVLKNHLS
jgi:hypothetical protein